MAALYQALLDDDGELAAELLVNDRKGKRQRLPFRTALARSLILAANDPARAAYVAETIADRLEGRPKQAVEVAPPHLTVFYKTGDPPAEMPATSNIAPPVGQRARASQRNCHARRPSSARRQRRS